MMQTLHINTSEVAAQEIMEFIQKLSQSGKEVELIDDKVFTFEKNGIDRALNEEQNGELFSSEKVLKELCGES